MPNLIKKYFYIMLPATTIFISILYSLSFSKISNFSTLMPDLTYIIIYFWVVYRVESLPYYIVVCLGLLKDILESTILGTNALCFLIFQGIIKSQIKYISNNNIFMVVWSGFMFCFAIIIVISFFLLHNAKDFPFNPTIIFARWFITIFAYVPVHWLLNKLHE